MKTAHSSAKKLAELIEQHVRLAGGTRKIANQIANEIVKWKVNSGDQYATERLKQLKLSLLHFGRENMIFLVMPHGFVGRKTGRAFTDLFAIYLNITLIKLRFVTHSLSLISTILRTGGYRCYGGRND